MRNVLIFGACMWMVGGLISGCANSVPATEVVDDSSGGGRPRDVEGVETPDVRRLDTSEPEDDGGDDDAVSADAEDAADATTSDVEDAAADVPGDACLDDACGPATGGCCAFDCDDAGVCVGSAGPCPDRCEANRLIVANACTGCGPANSAGTCEGGDVYACDASSQLPCATVRCGSNFYTCTNADGAWAWRADSACDDGDSCTTGDSCSGGTCAGAAYTCGERLCGGDRCEGTTLIEIGDSCDRECLGDGNCADCACEEAPKTCGVGDGNQCCVAQCDAVAGCSTVAGSCPGTDVCSDATTLQIASPCVGCGLANAVGTCAAPRLETCDASAANLCRQVTCGGASYVCSNAGGAWAWRTGNGCDDGNACSHSDVCFGGRCAGTAISCASDSCNERTCNGTATCTVTPFAGRSCDDGNVCTTGDSCSSAGVCQAGTSAAVCGDGVCNCGETVAGCAVDCRSVLPSNACVTGTQTRQGCSRSRTISRGAASGGWNSGSQNTCSASDSHDDSCPSFDVGNDHTYALYMVAGERVTVVLNAGTSECASGEYFNSWLKFKFSNDTTNTGATTCPTFVGCWGGPNEDETFNYTRTYDATSDGWLHIIVDGAASAFDEHRGYYTLGVTLSRCESANCGC